jgi:L-asparaginase II
MSSVGDSNYVSFLRSAAKPFQVLPFLEYCLQHEIKLSAEEIALMCSSHSGTDFHVKAVAELQARFGVHVEHLLTGAVSAPFRPGMLTRRCAADVLTISAR